MLQYIKNILPRLQQFSKDLDTKENFTEKRWVMLDTDNNTHEYFFKKDGKLLLFMNGDGKQGTWELLDSGKRIVVEVNNEIKLLQSAFIQDGLFVLKKSASDELAFALFNPTVIKDGNIEKYIESILAEGGRNDPGTLSGFREYETDKGLVNVLFKGEIQSPLEGDKLVFAESGLPVPDGTYTLKGDVIFDSFQAVEGRIAKYSLKGNGSLQGLVVFFGIVCFIIILALVFKLL